MEKERTDGNYYIRFEPMSGNSDHVWVKVYKDDYLAIGITDVTVDHNGPPDSIQSTIDSLKENIKQMEKEHENEY